MSYEITGEIIEIGNELVFGTGGFRKRQLVIDTGGQYPQQVPIDFTGSKCDLLDKYQAGQQVTVMFDVRGREWNGRYFCSLQAWRIKTDAETQATTRKAPARNDERQTPVNPTYEPAPIQAYQEQQQQQPDGIPF